VVQQLVDGLVDREAGLEAFLDVLPEELQDEWWAEGEGSVRNSGTKANKATEAGSLDAAPPPARQWDGSQAGLVEAGLAQFLASKVMDACAARVLVLRSPPRSCRALSSLTLAPGESLQRALVVGHSGEEVVLVWRLRVEEALIPQYKGLGVAERWVVCSITGEPADQLLPCEPSPAVPPEAVVTAQLEALRELDIKRCYNFASPANRVAFNNNVDLFISMLSVPAYSVLLAHSSAEILETKQISPFKFMAVVGVRGGREHQGVSAVFVWVCSLQPEHATAFADCWLTDAVYRADSAAPQPPPRQAP